MRNIQLLRRLLGAIREFSPDIIHVLAPGAIWLVGLLPFIRRYPLLTTVHDTRRHPGDREALRSPRQIVKILIRRSTAIVVHGKALQARAQAGYGLDLEKIHVIPHLALFRYPEIARTECVRRPIDGRFRVLFFGRILEYKGLRYLIESQRWTATHVPKILYIIAGRGSLEPYPGMSENADHFDIRNRYINDEETADLFLNADVVVLPYTEASESGVAAMAIAFGLPIVATKVGELPETVRHEQTGLTVKPRDSQGLAEAIIRLAKDEELRKRCGDAARRLARSERGPERIGQAAIRVYRTLLGQNEMSAQPRHAVGNHSRADLGDRPLEKGHL